MGALFGVDAGFGQAQALNWPSADQMLGDLVDRARRLGVPTPLVSTAYTNLKVYQRRRAR